MTLLLSYYGDDFTGSTDVMEALASHGIRTVLFTRLPAAAEFALFANYNAIGLAGTSRSQSPDWMTAELPALFAWLKSLNAKYCHYKVCSTFDSSPGVGSIGRAIEIGLDVFQQHDVAMIVGAPQLKRYSFAGHLFAAYQNQVYRIDRHPVMSRHPVTPMNEADLLVHLAKQTSQHVKLIDVYDAQTQLAAGQTLRALPANMLPFIVGSSGVEYALLSALQQAGELETPADFLPVPPQSQILVVSGSVSPTTERQIRFALNNGFVGIAANPLKLAQSENQAECQRLVAASVAVLTSGQSPLIYTAMGAQSDQGEALQSVADGRQHISQALGKIARDIIERHPLSRLVIAGGDTSSHALSKLDIFALTTRHPLRATPGSPLCAAHSSNAIFNGLEIALKGGQVGGDDYFVQIRDGNVLR